MDFENFVKNRYREFYDASQRSALQRFGRTIDRVDGIIPLLKKNDPVLEPFNLKSLIRLSDAYRAYTRWKQAAKLLRRSLAQSKLTLPDGRLDIAFTPHALEALERTARMCLRSGFQDHTSWAAAVEAHVALWNATVELAVTKGTVSVSLIDPTHADAAEFEDQVVSKTILGELPSHRWLGARRGEKAEILKIDLELPWDAIKEQARARIRDLGLLAQKRGVESIIDELISNDLAAAVRVVLDHRSEESALDIARTAYLSLIDAPPIAETKVIAVHVVNKGKLLGIAILEKGGQVRHKFEVEVQSDEEIEKVCRDSIAEHNPEAAILAAAGSEDNRLGLLERVFGDLPNHRVLTVALADARRRFSMGKAESSAIVIGRRALKPAREWSKISPIGLGLGEYCRDLDQEKLANVLDEAKALSSRERSRRGSTPKADARAYGRVGKRLNPMVKTIRDLRPGMMVDGVITNITRFGAFVNIGLPTEGMIHVSQLANEFVENPSQVVKVGQHVTARVIELIPEKHRIALSLKPAPEHVSPDAGGAAQRFAGKPGSASKSGTKGRSSALADLDALFKK